MGTMTTVLHQDQQRWGPSRASSAVSLSALPHPRIKGNSAQVLPDCEGNPSHPTLLPALALRSCFSQVVLWGGGCLSVQMHSLHLCTTSQESWTGMHHAKHIRKELGAETSPSRAPRRLRQFSYPALALTLWVHFSLAWR